MRIEDRIKQLEKVTPPTVKNKEHTPEELKEIAEDILSKSDAELEGGMFTPEQRRRIARRMLQRAAGHDERI